MANPEDAIERRLAELVQSLRKVGTVEGTSGNKVFVRIQGSLLLLPRLESYTPVNGHVVVVQGPEPYLVLGRPAP